MDIERIFREESGRILATLIGLIGSFDVAEEAMQEAFAVVLRSGQSEAFLRTRVPGWYPRLGTRRSIPFGAPPISNPSAGNCSRLPRSNRGLLRKMLTCQARTLMIVSLMTGCA